MAPKGKSKSSKTAASSRKTSVGASGLTTPAGGPDGSVVGTPAPGSNYGVLDELSYWYTPRPFKSAAWQAKKDSKPRAKNSKQIMTAERERAPRRVLENGERGEQFGYFSLHPPPSLLPPKKYCDITGLEAPYRDPNTGLQYHSREVYEVIKTLPRGADQQYLEIRGKASTIK